MDSKVSRAQAVESKGRPPVEGPALQSSRIFDNIARTMSGKLPRRKALAFVARGLASAALAELGINSAWAARNCLCLGQSYDPQTQCCMPTGVQPKYPLTSTLACPNKVPHPGYTPATNGCAPSGGQVAPYVPNQFGQADFRPCCNSRDTCYGTCNSGKSTCDNSFSNCLSNSCVAAYSNQLSVLAYCRAAVTTHLNAVNFGGAAAFEAGQNVACDCCGTATCPQSCTTGADCGASISCGFCLQSYETGAGVCISSSHSVRCFQPWLCQTSAQCPLNHACIRATSCPIALGPTGVCLPVC
jgi:hypothetical protein